MIPSAKNDAFVKPPPDRRPKRPSMVPASPPSADSLELSTPGNTINDPIRKTRIREKVIINLFLSSSTLQIFFIFSINFFIWLNKFANIIRFLNNSHLSPQFLLLQLRKICGQKH